MSGITNALDWIARESCCNHQWTWESGRQLCPRCGGLRSVEETLAYAQTHIAELEGTVRSWEEWHSRWIDEYRELRLMRAELVALKSDARLAAMLSGGDEW